MDIAANAQEPISRRDAIRRGAVLGGALVWTVPAVQSITRPAFAGTPKALFSYAALVVCDGEGRYAQAKYEADSGDWEVDPGQAPHCGLTGFVDGPGGDKRRGDDLKISDPIPGSDGQSLTFNISGTWRFHNGVMWDGNAGCGYGFIPEGGESITLSFGQTSPTPRDCEGDPEPTMDSQSLEDDKERDDALEEKLKQDEQDAKAEEKLQEKREHEEHLEKQEKLEKQAAEDKASAQDAEQ